MTIQKKYGQQGGADQPATAPESKPEDKVKPKPKSEGRPQYRVAGLKRSIKKWEPN
jgi:hypothetical protein